MNLRDERDEWQSLLQHPKWTLLKQYADEQIAARTARVLGGDDPQREEDKMRGEIFGIGLFMRYPETLVETLTVELDNQAEEK